jgi:hypothetical protein
MLPGIGVAGGGLIGAKSWVNSPGWSAAFAAGGGGGAEGAEAAGTLGGIGAAGGGDSGLSAGT